jgi:hypothetical protein
MLTFRRSASDKIMNMWWELSSLVEGISLSDEEDQIMWNFTSTGKYAVQSLYATINHKRVTPILETQNSTKSSNLYIVSV